MDLHNLQTILPAIGYLGIFSIIFAESGLLIGFFLPGDSLLFTAGFLASQGIFDIRLMVIGCFIAAVVGDNVGYMFGHKVGRRLFRREKSLLFHPDHIKKAQVFYEKHGGKTIILARFLPAVRTFAPILAGVGSMSYRTFFLYNLIGGFLWAVMLPLTGYFLGSVVPDVDKYLLPIIGLIILISIAPQAVHILKDKNHRKQLLFLLQKPFQK